MLSQFNSSAVQVTPSYNLYTEVKDRKKRNKFSTVSLLILFFFGEDNINSRSTSPQVLLQFHTSVNKETRREMQPGISQILSKTLQLVTGKIKEN